MNVKEKILSISLIIYSALLIWFGLNYVFCDYYAYVARNGCYLHFEMVRSIISKSLLLYLMVLELSCVVSHFLLLSLVEDKKFAVIISMANFAFTITGNIESIIVMLVLITYKIKSEFVSAIILTIASIKIYVVFHAIRFFYKHRENVLVDYVIIMALENYDVLFSCGMNIFMLLRVSVVLLFIKLKGVNK